MYRGVTTHSHSKLMFIALPEPDVRRVWDVFLVAANLNSPSKHWETQQISQSYNLINMWYFCFIFCFIISRWPRWTMLVVMVTMHRYTKGNFLCKKVEGSLQYAWTSKDIHTLGHTLLLSAHCRFIGFFQVVEWITDFILAAYHCIYITCGGICQRPDAPRICIIYGDVKALMTFSCVTLCKLWAQLWTVRWLCETAWLL